MKKIVVSLGGSILIRGEDDLSYLGSLKNLLLKFTEDHRLIIVTGGGRTARNYIGLGRGIGADEATLDWVGIGATRLNAWLLISILGPKCHPKPFETVEEALSAGSSSRIVVGGGTHPGHTTDAVSALIAERWGADHFINLTAVNGAYTTDPEKHPDAKRIGSITTRELVDLVSSTSSGAGSHSVMDPLASRIIHRANLRTSILNGRDLKAFEDCLYGRPFDGTVVRSSSGEE